MRAPWKSGRAGCESAWTFLGWVRPAGPAPHPGLDHNNKSRSVDYLVPAHCGSSPHLANVLDAWRHHKLTLERKMTWTSVPSPAMSNMYPSCHLKYNVPQGKIFWLQSACNPRRESFRHFPTSRHFLFEDPRNLQETGRENSLNAVSCWFVPPLLQRHSLLPIVNPLAPFHGDS